MENEDRKNLKQNVASVSRDDEKEIEIHGGAGKKGIRVLKVGQWKIKCDSYFNRYYKTSNFIVVPSEKDLIMDTLREVCSGSKSRGFVFKNYNIVNHLQFLGYDESSLNTKLGITLKNQSISYIAYIEQKNVILICNKLVNGDTTNQCLKNIVAMVKYFLTLYNSIIQASGVVIIGLLIREKENQSKLFECNFCHLFSPSYEVFESPTTFKHWLNCIENYGDWWDLENLKKGKKLFNDLAAEILCFMALQEKGLPSLTDDKNQQFKQTYMLYTPQQMDILFSDAKNLVIQGSYGSGKSILGLKKLELISKCLKQDERIIYINFDSKSYLHFLMEKNVREYVRISSRKIIFINSIRQISESPDGLIYVCHNSEDQNLSSILQEKINLNMRPRKVPRTKFLIARKVKRRNFHLIVEEYDGETLVYDEADQIIKLVQTGEFQESNIIILAQPLMKKRIWNKGKESFEKETCMFHKLEDVFKIVKLDEVLRCSNEICNITKLTQNFVQNKDSVFTTTMNIWKLKQRQQLGGEKSYMVSHSPQKSNYPDGTYLSKKTSELEASNKVKYSYSVNNLNKTEKKHEHGIGLDQAFEKYAQLENSNSGKNKIVNKFGFLCQPRQGVDIKGLKPSLVEFSEEIVLTSDMAAISLSLVLKEFIGKNERTTLLYITDEQPAILRRAVTLFPRLFDNDVLYTESVEVYLQEKKKSKIIFSSNFRSVNGMEFDHVVILVSQSEYFLKYYLPLVISRCTYHLTFVLLPKERDSTKQGYLKRLSSAFSRKREDETQETVAYLMGEFKRECLMNHLSVTECQACEENCHCYCMSDAIGNKLTLKVHTHSDQYKTHLHQIRNSVESEEATHGTSASILAEAK